MKDKSYIFVYNGKLLQHESLLQLKSQMTEDDWTSMVGQSIDFFMQLYAIHKSDLKLEKKDLAVLRSLKRTLLFIKKLDPIAYAKLYDDDRLGHYQQTAAEEISNAEQTIRIGYGDQLNNSSDIVVSNLD